MGKRKQLHARAGIDIPVARIGKMIRKAAHGHKVSKNSIVSGAGIVAAMLTILLEEAEKKGTEKDVRITAKHFSDTLNDPKFKLYGVVPKRVSGINQ